MSGCCSWVLVGALLAGCTTPEGQRASSTPAPAPASPAPKPCATLASVTSSASEEADAVSRLDLNGDGELDAAVRTPGCGLRCDYRLAVSRGGCWVAVGEIVNVMSAPACRPAPQTRGALCELSAMRLMLHGDAQEHLFLPGERGYPGHETAGERYVPSRPKPPRR